MLKRLSQSPIRTRSNKKYQKDPKKKQLKQHTIHNEDKLKVFIKFKPINRYQNQNIQQLKYIDDKSIEIKTTLKNKIYHFDHVFNGYQDHNQVFEIGCKQIIDNVFVQTYQHSINNHGLIFVYGNTGTGKTYSMGLLNSLNNKSQGIVPDSLKYIFQMKRKKCFQSYNISVAFSEIYMDQVYDLLDFQNDTKLTIRQDSKSRQPYIQNQTVIQVKNADQAFEIINIGLQKRKVAQQRMNRKSSRGHGLITINIISNGNEKPGKICFIDLAGCQRLKDSQSKGTVLTEALHINSSLSCLETLLMNISDQTIRNYRSSKLTRILQPYIQSGKINLFVTTNYENINAIEFAKRCKGIKFLQKQIKLSTTPIKKSKVAISENAVSKMARQLEQLYLYKKQSIDKEKKYISCINNLINIINKLSYEVQNIVKNQTINSQYSFSEILNNPDIQKKINQKIKLYEAKQANFMQKIIQKINKSNSFELDFTQFIHKIGNPQEFIKKANQKSSEMISILKDLGRFSENKNTYKKQFFTTQFKLHLLENKCFKYEDGIYYLMKYMNTTDKRVIKRLKQLNISINKQNLQNIPNLKNKKTPTKYIQKSQCIIKQFIQEQSSIDISQRRNAIYIDEF